MKTKALAAVAVRIMGLIALYKGAMAGVNLLMLLVGAALATNRPAWRTLAFQGTAIAIATVVPLLVGFLCLRHGKRIGGLLSRGLDEDP